MDQKLHGWIIASLAVAQTLCWAAYYYAFPALLLFWEADLGWSRTQLTFAFTVSLIMSAVFAPISGRLIDKGLGHLSLTGSAVAGGILIIALSFTQTYLQFLLVWLAIGVAMAGSLYEPCFAFLTRCVGDQARKAITRITLIAGLAGTVSFPSAHYLTLAFGWRGAVVVFGLAVLLVAAPLTWTAARKLEREHKPQGMDEENNPGKSTRAVLLSPIFLLLTLAFALAGINHNSISSHLLPVLAWKGLPSDSAVFAAALVGPMQVFGRLLMITVENRVSMLAIAHACFAGLMLASLALLGAGSGDLLLVGLFVVLQGASHGVTSIAKPVVIAELLGRRNFGVISGAMAVPYMLGFAAAPFLSSFVWEIGDYDLVLKVTLVFAILALMALMVSSKIARKL